MSPLTAERTSPTHHHDHAGGTDPMTNPNDVDVDEPARCAVNPHHTLRDDEHTTCLACIARTRTLILEIVENTALLPDAIRTLVGISYDHATGTRAADDTPIPGGPALVMLAPGTTSPVTAARPCTAPTCDHTRPDCPISHALDHLPSDPPPVRAVLAGIATAWRRHLHHAPAGPGDDPATYLLDHLRQAAETYPGFVDDHDTLHQLHTRITVVTGTTDRPEVLAAPCMHCGGRITRAWTDTGLGDLLECEGCGMRWEHGLGVPGEQRTHLPAAYLLAQRAALQTLPDTHPELLVTLEDAKRILKERGVRPNRLDLWAHRGLLEPAGRDVRGVVTYRLGDLAGRAM